MTSRTGFESGSVLSGHASPDSEFLPGINRILEAVESDGALVADLPSRVDGFTPNGWIWNVFREVQLWEPLARHVASSVNGHEQLGVWMSLVKHRIEPIGGGK